MKTVYLDNAATTEIDPLVAEEMASCVKNTFGNPSSIYKTGRDAKELIEKARARTAALIGSMPEEIIFTSGGAESDNFALKGIAYANLNKGNHIITTEIEHDAVLESAGFLETQGFDITYIKPDRYGWIDPDKIKKAVTNKTVLISVMHANNEIGTIEPIKEIGFIAKENEIFFHTDAVQTVGHIPVNVNELQVDLLSLSAHKIYGPKGAGALYIRKGVKIIPFMHGGGQEKRLRAGTENIIGIVGLGKAAELAKKRMDTEKNETKKLRDILIKELFKKIPDIKLNGHPQNRAPNNVNIAIPGIEGEALILGLDKYGICASTGSACSSMELGPSHVLLAIGLTKQEAHSSIRLTLGRNNTKDDINKLLDILPKIVRKLR